MPRAICVAAFVFFIFVLHSDRAFAQDAAALKNAGPQFHADGPNADEFQGGLPKLQGSRIY